MLKENWRFIARIERFGDFILIILSFFVAYYGRASLIYWDEKLQWNLPFAGRELAPLNDYFIVLLISLITFIFTLNWMGAYGSMRLTSKLDLLRISLVSSFIVFVTLSSVLFLLKIDLSRSFVALFCLLVGLSLATERFLVLEMLRFWRRQGKNFRNIIVAGIGDQALRFAVEILRRPEIGLVVRSFGDLRSLPPEADSKSRDFKEELKALGYDKPIKIVQGTKALSVALKEYAIDEIVFTDVVEVMPQVEEAILIASEQGIRTTIIADLFSVGMVKSGMSYFGDMPLIHFQTPPGDRWELSVKRLLDILVSVSLLVVLSPLLLLVALGVRLTSSGPILFRQKRMGLNGRIFTLVKFRSMYVGAENELSKLLSGNEMRGPAFKLRKDPRITKFGRFLRRFSIDELPQLWNVFIGDMSLVGPRPPVPGEVSMYERRDRRRLSMRPGLTCTWQVSGRSNISDFESWVRLDLEYIDNWSLGRDFILLFRTIPAVLFGSGAR